MPGYGGSLDSFMLKGGNQKNARCGRLATVGGFTDAPAAAGSSQGKRSTSTILILALAFLILFLSMSIAIVCWFGRRVIRCFAKLSVMLGKLVRSGR